MYIESANLAKDHAETALNNYLNLVFDHDGTDYEAGKIYGTHNPLSAQMGFMYYGGPNTHYSVDRMSTIHGEVLFTCEDGHGRMIRHKGETYKTISSSVLIGAFADGRGFNSKPYFFSEMLNYFLGINEDKWALSIAADPYEGGTTSGAAYYDAGEQAYLTATAHEGWEFIGWMDHFGMTISDDPDFVYTMPDQHAHLEARFQLITATAEMPAPMLARVYPNPASEQLSLHVSQKLIGSGYILSDLTGRVLMSGVIHDQANPVNISQLNAGVYLIRFIGYDAKPISIVKH